LPFSFFSLHTVWPGRKRRGTPGSDFCCSVGASFATAPASGFGAATAALFASFASVDIGSL
jgi:hypothetical protein